MRPLTALLLLAATAGLAPHARAESLPPGLVRLADVDGTIRQDMRYAGPDNFLGRPVKGYEAPACILTRAAAEALSRVQQGLAGEGLALVVFDCYRPARAVSDMVAWTLHGGAPDPRWYPRVRRDALMLEGYVGTQSSHSHGSTVDLAIASLSGTDGPPPRCGATVPGMLDFGTGFDCFDPSSETASLAVGTEAAANRNRLVTAMRQAGFRNYAREWWHFTLRDEPFSKKRFDFPISDR